MSGTRLGMVRCEHCGRQFNPHSGARHIPWCAKQQSDSRKHRLSAEKRRALERYKWRISYKPSNQIFNQQQPHRGASTSTAAPERTANKARKSSSINSSTTLSSLSASSTTSLGTSSVASVGEGHRQVKTHSSRTQPRQAGRAGVAQLKRSVSSLTLTKQRGAIDLNGGVQLDKQRARAAGGPLLRIDLAQQKRTKSVSDLNRDMNEVVGLLAKRMEEIYAQNKILLANMQSRSERASCRTVASPELYEEERLIERCHHCKSSRLDGANYCHKCGCKVRAGSSSAASSSLSPVG